MAERVLQLTGLAMSELSLLGAEILSPHDEQQRAGIVTFRWGEHSPEQLREHCRSAGIVLSCRGGGLRVSPHAYNDEADVERLLEALRGVPR